MASAQPLDFAGLMPKVAPLLCGDPNKAMSKGSRLRFGTHGSMEIDTDEGWYDDHEGKSRGGVLALIQHKLGCDMAGALSWLEEQGLKDREARSAEVWQIGQRPTGGKMFYDYHDADGRLAYRVERRGKDKARPFLQHGPDGKGGFHAAPGCMQGVSRLPYRLPQLLAANPDAIVFVVEGEKDADRLAMAGLVATTNSGGALKFGAELVPWFESRRVVIIPDNDDPGREHAADVADKLRPVTTALAILDLPGLPTKGDVSDWLAAGGTVQVLIEQYAEPALAGAKIEPETFPLIDLTWWANSDPTPRTFAIEKIMPAGEVTLFTGPGGVGKSQLGQQMATCFAACRPLFGLATAGGATLYVTAEDDERELHWRQVHICKALAIPMQDLAGKLYPISLRGRLNNEIATFDHEGRLHATPSYAMLRATIEKTGAKLVFLDNVAHLFAGNENDRGQVTAFANLLAALCRDYGCTIVLIGHPNKVGDDYSGSTAWLNAVRSQITLKRPEGEVDADARVLTLGKANYARTGEQVAFRWHDFAFVSDADLPADQRAEIAANITASADKAIFLACLTERNKQHRAVSERHSPTYAPRQFAAMSESKGIGRIRLEKAMDRLFRIGAIERAEVWRGDDRKAVFGLRETVTRTSPANYPQTQKTPENSHFESAGNTMRATQRETRGTASETAENRAGNAGETHTYTTYRPGAAEAAAAPDTGWHSNPALGRHRDGSIPTKFPPSRGGETIDLSKAIFGPDDEDDDPAADEFAPDRRRS